VTAEQPTVAPAEPQSKAGQLGLNAAGVPGGISAVPVGTIVAGGLVWDPSDAEPHSASIGYALAAETAAAAAVEVEAGAS
jgi:hypothetical protein